MAFIHGLGFWPVENALDLHDFTPQNIEMANQQELDGSLKLKVTASIEYVRSMKTTPTTNTLPISGNEENAVGVAIGEHPSMKPKAAAPGTRSLAAQGNSSAGGASSGEAPVAPPAAIATQAVPVSVEGAPAESLPPAPTAPVQVADVPVDVPAPIAQPVAPVQVVQDVPAVAPVVLQDPMPAPVALAQGAPADVPAPLLAPVAAVPAQALQVPPPVAAAPTRVQPKRRSSGGESAETKKARIEKAIADEAEAKAALTKILDDPNLTDEAKLLAIFKSVWNSDQVTKTLIDVYDWHFQHRDPDYGCNEDVFMRPGLPKISKHVVEQKYVRGVDYFDGKEAVETFIKGLFATMSDKAVLEKLGDSCERANGVYIN